MKRHTIGMDIRHEFPGRFRVLLRCCPCDIAVAENMVLQLSAEIDVGNTGIGIESHASRSLDSSRLGTCEGI